MTDVADFLLARIAEDEVVAVQLDELWAIVTDADRRRLDAGVREGMDSVFAVADGAPRDGAPSRLLAECEAKRPIVAQFSDTAWCGCAVRDYVLGQLALPYAGHPDYQEAWRP
jgi:hypothetical protein